MKKTFVFTSVAALAMLWGSMAHASDVQAPKKFQARVGQKRADMVLFDLSWSDGCDLSLNHLSHLLLQRHLSEEGRDGVLNLI